MPLALQSQGRATGGDRVLEGFLEDGALELGLQRMSRSLLRMYRTGLWVEWVGWAGLEVLHLPYRLRACTYVQ